MGIIFHPRHARRINERARVETRRLFPFPNPRDAIIKRAKKVPTIVTSHRIRISSWRHLKQRSKSPFQCNNFMRYEMV